MFAPSPSLHSCLFLLLAAFTPVFYSMKVLYTEKNTIVYAKQFGFDATIFKVEENSRTFQGLTQKFKDFSRKNGIQGLFKDSP